MKQFKFNERQRFSIRKFSIGAASVLLGSVFFAINSVAEVQAMEASSNTVLANNVDQELGSEPTTQPTELSPSSMTPEEDKNNSESGILVSPILDSNPKKQALAKLIEEIDGKISSGAYDEKTEDSVNRLKAVLEEAKATVNTATAEGELTQAHSRLVTATTQLKTKSEDKEQAPAVDTTNGKATVGTKATNTEKTSESNSIANSGSRDERNGKALNTNNPFRTDSTTTDTDTSANQTYTAPAADANLATLSNELKNLPNFIENNKKVQDMDTLGNALNVEKGSVTEINEFGGWKAVGDTGKFAIARKTEAGVFPIETVNTVWADRTKSYVTWVLEQSFNRDSDYMLFLSKVRTKASSTEEAYDNSTYVSTGLGNKIAKGVKGFDGIQKTFKAYSKEHGSKVIVSFKTGYTGDIDGTKAQYKVEVIINRNGQEEKLYNQTFTPEVSKTNTEMTVVKASDGKNSPQSFSTPGTPLPTKAELEAKMANNKPNGTGGTFKSREIELPEGITEYTVRISSADNLHLGMGYQSPYRHYALPVTGLDFNVDQDTGAIAKDLLSRIYDKLKATESADTDGKTNETKAAYLAELENIKTLVTSTDVKKTVEYKEALEAILSKQLALKVDKTGLTDSKALLDGLVNEDPTPGKTQDTAAAYNAAKQEAIKAIEAAKTVIDNENATVAQVREALATVNAKKTALQQAKDGLIEAATTEEKAKLKTDSDSLVKADTTGKTPNSIEAYNTKYEELKAQLEAAKTEAATALAKENNASKAEVQAAQTKVDAAKAELTKAAELLVNKADKAELTNAKAALNTLATEADPTTGKTADSAKAYNDAKTAAQEAIQAAETVINDENATPDQVTEALNKVNEKKTALQQAKDGLIEAATTEEKAKLKTDSDSLVKADTTGKTPNSIEAYNTKYEELKAQLEAAKTEAATALAKENNASKAEVQAAQAKVDAVKTELESAKNLLVEAATAEEKAKLKADADSLVKADETGKTADSIKAYEAEFEKLKAQLEAAKTEAAAVLAKGDNATKTEAQEAQAKVDAAKKALDKAAESLKDLDREGAKKEIADAAKKATDAIEASTSLTPEQKAEEKAKVAKEAKDAIDAIDNATTEEGINSAKENGKLAIEKEAAITAIKAEQAAKEQEIDNNTKLSDEEKAAAKAEVVKAAIEAVEAIQKAETQEAVNAAQEKGETAIKAVTPIGKEKALEAIQTTTEAKLAEIDKNTNLSAEEKASAKAEVAKAAIEAVEAIQKAETQEAVNAAQEKGETAIKAVTPIGKEKALEAIQTTTEAKLAEIDKNTNLSAEEKASAKAEVAKAAIEAVEAIQKAETQEAVNAAQEKGETAIKAVTPIGKEKALEAIQTTTEAKLAEIDKNTNLSAEEKAAAKAEVAKAAIEAVEAIKKADTKDAVEAAKTKGEAAIKAVNPIGKEKALDAIQKAAEEKIAEIDKNDKLSAEEKAAAKAEVAKAAIEAVTAIQEAETQEAVNAAQAKGETAIKTVNPVGKEKALEAIQTTTEAKLAEIDKNTNLSAEEKASAKAEVAKAAIEAVEAIQKAETQEAVNAAQEKGETAIKAVTPIGKEKALEAIQTTTEAKLAEIDKNTNLSAEEKASAKAEVAKAAIEAVEAIQKAETQEAVNAAQAKGETAIKAVNPLGKEQAKAAIDKALAEKEKAIDASTDLTDAEKEVAKKLARAEAETAKKAIDNATDSEAVENALRTFLYQIDQELLVYKRPELDFEALLQSSVTGVVRVELGKAISQADVLAKLNMPDEISVLSIELPDTNTVGTKYAKVTLQLADGTQRVIEVPIEVVAPQNQDNSPTHDGRDNGSSNAGEKVNKSKLDRAIHQLESFIKQSGEISKEANDLLSEAKKLFADPNASQAEVDAMVKRIEDFMLKGSLANNQASQVSAVIPARVEATVNQVADTNERKVAKELPNTGTTESVVAMIAAAASALLGLGLAGRRKEDEEA